MDRRRPQYRLAGYDYTQPGFYFVTICTRDRACVLGRVEGDKVMLSPTGRSVDDAWRDLPRTMTGLAVDSFIVMPNHIHGLIEIAEGSRGLCAAIQAFKSLTTRRAGRGGLWQRGYYDHIVRREDDLGRIRAYIHDNPARWSSDRENPERHVGRQ